MVNTWLKDNTLISIVCVDCSIIFNLNIEKIVVQRAEWNLKAIKQGSPGWISHK
jgi:hypothetical protein